MPPELNNIPIDGDPTRSQCGGHDPGFYAALEGDAGPILTPLLRYVRADIHQITLVAELTLFILVAESLELVDLSHS